jgi:hypothetical protein
MFAQAEQQLNLNAYWLALVILIRNISVSNLDPETV